MSGGRRSSFRAREKAWRDWHKRFKKAPVLPSEPAMHSCFLAAWRESRRYLLRQVMQGVFTMTDGTPILVPTEIGRTHLAKNMHDDEDAAELRPPK